MVKTVRSYWADDGGSNDEHEEPAGALDTGSGRGDDRARISPVGPAPPTGPARTGPDDRVATDVHDAWRLAFVVVGDRQWATKAVTKAFVDASPADALSAPSRVELLEATLRISLTRAGEDPDRDGESAVITALWQLPPEQRAALWLTTVYQLDNSTLGAVLSLTPANAAQVAKRAEEWLDVALDHESGPLCEREVDLADFTAGLLAPDEADQLEEHLPGCRTCRTKLRASVELTDLKAVLTGAVPEPPAGLTIRALELEERTRPSDGAPSLAEPPRPPPALRWLAACCAALIVVAIIGVSLVRPTHHAAGPVVGPDPRAILPALSNTAANSDFLGSSARLAGGAGTTIVATTTSIPAVTFPTLPHR